MRETTPAEWGDRTEVLRIVRKFIGVGMPVAGMFIVFAAVLTPQISVNLQLQIIVVLIGVLMIEAGVWKLTNPFMPSERRYGQLRREVEAFITLVRDLNAAAVRSRTTGRLEDEQEAERVLSEMHRSVTTMGTLAGREASRYPSLSVLDDPENDLNELLGSDDLGLEPELDLEAIPQEPQYRV